MKFFLISEIVQKLQDGGGPAVHVQTIRRRLDEAGLHARVAAKKPLISKKNAKARYRFAKVNRRRPLHYFQRPMWSDECTIDVHGHNSKRHCRRPKGKAYDRRYLKSTVKFGGGKIMVGLLQVFFILYTIQHKFVSRYGES